MFTIDTTSNKDYYIIKKDGKEFAKVSRKNDLAAVKKHFGIEIERKEGEENAQI